MEGRMGGGRRERRKRVRTQGGGKKEGGMWGESKDETVGSGKKEVTGGERCREGRKEKRDQQSVKLVKEEIILVDGLNKSIISF